MPSFEYVGDEGRYYPDLMLSPKPGEVVDLVEAPADGRWNAAQTGQEAPSSASATSGQDGALKAAETAVVAAQAAENQAEADLAALQAKGNG